MDTGLECSMDGFVDMAKKMSEDVLLIAALIKEALASVMPESIKLFMIYFWDGLVGLSSW